METTTLRDRKNRWLAFVVMETIPMAASIAFILVGIIRGTLAEALDAAMRMTFAITAINFVFNFVYYDWIGDTKIMTNGGNHDKT